MIKADTHTDDHAIKVNFDATPYFEKASDEDLARLIECGFASYEPADQVAIHLADTNPEIAAMFRYLEARDRTNRKSSGFEVNINEDQALAWLRQKRPNAFRTLNLGDYDLAMCDSCGRISDRDDMSKREKRGEMRCEECQTTTYWVTRNPETGDIEIPDSLHPGDEPYPSTSHAIGFIDGPEDDTNWMSTWLNERIETNHDGTAVRPEGSDQPWAQLHQN